MGARNKITNTKVTTEDFDLIKAAAERADQSMSEWIRNVCLAAAGKCPMCGQPAPKTKKAPQR